MSEQQAYRLSRESQVKGGFARAAALSKRRRSEIARLGAMARARNLRAAKRKKSGRTGKGSKE